ncbi:hypothetical protein D3C81_1314770 [compost metagenome]
MPSSRLPCMSSGTLSWLASAGTLSPRRCSMRYQVSWYSRCRRCSASSGPSAACRLMPSTSRRSVGRCCRALASLSRVARAGWSSSLEPAAKGTLSSCSSPPSTSPAISLNGACTARRIRLRRVCQTIGATLNSGLLRSPCTGRAMSMLPWVSLSSATARRTGRSVALGLSTRSPSCRSSSSSLLSAFSRPFSMR